VLTETPELRVNGDWLCLNIESGAAWPTRAQPFTFEGHQLWVMPHTSDNYPGLAMNRPADLDRDDAWALLHRALSYVAWMENSGAMVAFRSGGNLPRMMGLGGKGGGVILRDTFDFSEVHEAADERGRMALALMREARGLNHPAYAFLSFFRVLEVAIPNGKARGDWVAANLENAGDHRAKEAVAKLRETGIEDIGVHLRESGRHAIAHAKADPIINPDDPRDAKRLQAELPIIEGLAVLAVETQLGIQTSHSIWKEHLYELKGWKRIFGADVVAAVLAGIPPEEGQVVDAPTINVRLRRGDPYAPFEAMTPVQAGYGDQRIEVVYRSADSLVDLVFWLNFAEERLVFDVQNSIKGWDDGSVAAARNGKEIDRFFRDYFLNGELQMWNAENGELISRCDAFLPINVMVNIDAFNEAINRWDDVIAEREAAE
jgi:hypothetical protein